jgi:putative DNA primase/helicase
MAQPDLILQSDAAWIPNGCNSPGSKVPRGPESAIQDPQSVVFGISKNMGASIVKQSVEERRQAAIDAHEIWASIERRRGNLVDETPFEPGPKAQMVPASAVAPRRVEWLWPDRIPLGMPTLFSGDPKLGKSLAALSLIASVSRGGPLPGARADSLATAPRGSAILLSAEDDPAQTIVPRLIAAGADLERVHIISTIVESDFRNRDCRILHSERMPTLSADDLAAIEHRATALGDCRLIVFDPVSAYLGGPDGTRSPDPRRALTPLKQMAERLGAAVVLITHHSKTNASSTNGKYRVLGSIGYVGVCRANILFMEDPDDPTGRRVLMLDNGGNLAPPQPGLVYTVRDDGAGAFCDWLPETIDLDADAALARAVRAGKASTSGKSTRRRDCEDWLRGYLAGGPRPTPECEQAALTAGFNRPVLHRARTALAVRCLRSGFGKGACYHWSLPEAAIETHDCSDDGAGAHALHFAEVCAK